MQWRFDVEEHAYLLEVDVLQCRVWHGYDRSWAGMVSYGAFGRAIYTFTSAGAAKVWCEQQLRALRLGATA